MQYQKTEINDILNNLNEKINKTEEVLMDEYANIRTGRANPHILDKVTVDYYGTESPLNQVGNINIPESRCITITPWDKSMLGKIEKAILAANIGLTPINDGKLIRLTFPEITEEHRKQLSKDCKKLAEAAKVALRNERRNALDKFKKLEKSKVISEDELSTVGEDVEKIVAKSTKAIDELYKDKDKEVMLV